MGLGGSSAVYFLMDKLLLRRSAQGEISLPAERSVFDEIVQIAKYVSTGLSVSFSLPGLSILMYLVLKTYIFPVSGSGSAWLKSIPPSIST